MNVLQRVLKDPVIHVRTAAVITLLLGLFATVIAVQIWTGRLAVPGFSALMVVDASIMLILAIGMYRLSRVCTLLMLGYWIANRIYVLFYAGVGNGPIEVLITVVYVIAALQVFAYHKQRSSEGAS